MGRGRPKKIIEDEPADDLQVEEVETPVMNVTEVRKYSRPIDAGQDLSIETPPEGEEFIDESEKAFQDFMSDAEGEVPTIRIYKLKDYAKNGSSSFRNAAGDFCDEIPLTPDWLRIIKSQWGPGYYRVILMSTATRGVYKKFRLVSIAYPIQPAFPGMPAQVPGQPTNYTVNYPQAPGTPPVDPMKMFRDQIDMAQSLVKLGQSFTPPTANTALAPVDPNQAPAIVELKTRMEMFEKLAGLSPEKQAPLIQLVKGLGLMGDVEDAASGDRWLRILEGAMPLLQTGLALLLSRIAPPPTPLAPGAPTPIAGQLAAPQEPATPQPQPADILLAQIVQLIGTGIQQGQTSYIVEAAIENLFDTFPDSAAAQQCQLILGRPALEVVQKLGLQHPDSERWIGVLQANWNKADTPDTPEVMTFGGAE